MTRSERDEIMKCAGMLHGITSTFYVSSDDKEDEQELDTIVNSIRNVANDLECIAKGHNN